ncbi:hypothetical protein RclHR1_09310014 [Rhizophagus clarus]|uniref:Uncharacterized protein n=1 Tax=Rhizophagus clarus TaxID=94130 RepID=A0A2Z6SQG4_9GLOM|nr:hypothetical protein RclHR1_09310014 [Rhizophagus clarus]
MDLSVQLLGVINELFGIRLFEVMITFRCFYRDLEDLDLKCVQLQLPRHELQTGTLNYFGLGFPLKAA